MSKKRVRLHPYEISIRGTKDDISNLKDIFKLDNLEKNIVELHKEYPLILVIDSSNGDFLFGKLIKIRRGSVPVILDMIAKKQQTIKLKKGQDIVELSHFIWNVKDGILIGEYNYYGIRFFSGSLTNYLNERFSVKDNEVTMIDDIYTFDNFKKGGGNVKKYVMRVSKHNLKLFEEKNNLGLIGMFSHISKDNHDYYEISIKRGHRSEYFFDKDGIIKQVEGLRDGNVVDSIKVETQDAIFDLINDSVLRFGVDVERKGSTVDKNDFYIKIKSLYIRELNRIKRNMRTRT